MNGKPHQLNRNPSGRTLGLLVLWLISVMGASCAMAADRSDRDFVAASQAFRDLNYATAERWYGDFVKTYTNSPRRFEAILGQAEAQYFQTNSAGTIQLLSANLARAGKLAGDYLFWIAEAHFQSSNYLAAATNYARVRLEFPDSTNILAAAYSEAFAYSLLGQPTNVVQLLSPPESAFQTAAKTNARDPFVAGGVLLLARTLLEQKKFLEGEAALAELDGQSFGRELDWRRQELLCRLLMEGGRPQEALTATINLMALASAAERPELLAQSYMLKAGIYERLKEPDLAESVYTNNFATNVPPQFRRSALLKVIELDRRQDRATDSVENLEKFVTLYPQDPILDVIQFTLGEVRLQEYHRELAQALVAATNALPTQATNLLGLAVTNFTRVIDGFKQSPLVGKSFLDRGWCWWELANFPLAKVDFQAATQALPAGDDQALARFKLAESEVQLKEFTNAVQDFHLLTVQHAPESGSTTNSLVEQALNEMLGAAINIGNLAAAEEAFTNLSRWFPESASNPRASLSFGGSLIKGRPATARNLFEGLLEKFPKSRLVPEVHWAIARTYKREENWGAATGELDRWVANYPSNAALPQVEFERAILYARYYKEAEALKLFTNFVARFPIDTNAPAAQFWVGDHFFNVGEFALAETTFETLFQNTNWPLNDLKFMARLSAGQSAFARQDYKAARDYFAALINASECPPAIRGDALFELGNVSTRGFGTDPIFRDGYGDAINFFDEITKKYPTHPKAGLAEALIGNCYLQKASEEQQPDQVKKRLDSAIQASQKALEWPGADITTRSLAELSLALVLERLNKPDEAQNHLETLFYAKNVIEGEHADDNFLKEAGLELAKLFEEQQKWEQARKVCVTLRDTFPPLRMSMNLRIERIQKKSVEAKSL